MTTQGKRTALTRLRATLLALGLVLMGVVGVTASAQASAPGNILAPFPLGETWNVYQGYGPNAFSHNNNPGNPPSLYGLDLTISNSATATSGKTVVSPVSGTIQGNPSTSSTGSMCINMADGRSLTLTHINTSITGGSVSAGQTVGTVATPNTQGNNGVAHIHLQMWSSAGCWGTGNGGIPFDFAHNARICGASDLTATGPSAWNNGVWSGESITSASCASATDGTLLQVENPGSGWSVYNITQAAGINVKGKPGVLWGATGAPNVFAAGADGALRQFTTCPNGVGWCTYVVLNAGALGNAGVSVVQTSSAIEVFATTDDGTLLQVENTGSAWQSFNITQAVGNVHIKGAPAVLWGSSGPNVFAVDSNGAMRQFTLCPTGGWCSYVLTANNVFAGGVDATVNASNIELFARSTGNHLYQVEFASGSGWAVYDVTNFSGGVQIKGTPGVLWTSGGPTVYVSDSAGRLRQFAICPTGGWCTYELTQSGALEDGAGVDVVHNGSAIEVFAGSKG